MISRRQFMATATSAAAAALAPDRLLAALEGGARPLPDLSRWPVVREQFALDPRLLHFSSFYLASHPRPVRDAIEDFRRALDADPYETVDQRMFESENNIELKVRRDLSGYLGARPEEIAITGSTTMGLALVYHGLTLRPEDEILATTHDHYVHHESIRLAVERVGAKMRRVPLFESAAGATVAEITSRLRAEVRPETRVLGITWVHSSTGMRLPVRDIAAVVREVNHARDDRHRLLLVVDGVHGLGAVDESVADLGADFFCAGTHKWMFAPRGTGIIWAPADRWALLRPTIPTFSTLELYQRWMSEDTSPRVTVASDVTPGGFHAYEHQWAMSAAFRFHEQIGRPRVAARIRELNDRCKAGLAEIPGVTPHTPRDPALSAGLCCFEIRNHTPEDVVTRLRERRVVASTSPYRRSYARLAPSLVNSPEEVDAALMAVREIAAT